MDTVDQLDPKTLSHGGIEDRQLYGKILNLRCQLFSRRANFRC